MIPINAQYKLPPAQLVNYVERFWMLGNQSGEEQSIVVFPDGRVDILFCISSKEPYYVVLLGIDSEPSQNIIEPGRIIFAISFKLLAIEYILHTKVSLLLNHGSYLPSDFWGITADDLNDFESFCNKVSARMITLIPDNIDDRKRKLFELVYSFNGSITVKELSDQVYWSSRQINRYFNQQFGISLKRYCNILRFRASFQHIKEGKLFPEQNFADQAHFIREVKKFSGVAPKDLSKNINDRFIQFSTLPKE